MIATGALLHGDVPRHLQFDASEHPVALQLGGSDPTDLARAAKLGQDWGYDEINLNCGCPSDRVQRGAFGACLMAQPNAVASCVKAMQDAVTVPVTVKHRLGLDWDEDYGPLRDFVGTLHQAGVQVFIVHARNAVLKGLSPKDNRSIPPLRYSVAQRLITDFPDALFVLNGGLANTHETLDQLQTFKGVMLGRAAWHSPAILRELQHALWPEQATIDDDAIIARMTTYAADQVRQGVPLRFVARTMLGWANGMPGARQWRQMLSDAQRLNTNDPELISEAWRLLQDRRRQAVDQTTAT